MNIAAVLVGAVSLSLRLKPGERGDTVGCGVTGTSAHMDTQVENRQTQTQIHTNKQTHTHTHTTENKE